jgi:hypothetical protein
MARRLGAIQLLAVFGTKNETARHIAAPGGGLIGGWAKAARRAWRTVEA